MQAVYATTRNATNPDIAEPVITVREQLRVGPATRWLIRATLATRRHAAGAAVLLAFEFALLVGSAVNELVRVQDLTKKLGYPVLVTGPFASALAGLWQPLGEHILRGLDKPMPILTAALPS